MIRLTMPSDDFINQTINYKGKEWKCIGIGPAPRLGYSDGIYLCLSRPNTPVQWVKDDEINEKARG